METTHETKLTSAEQAVLWGSYQNDSLAICTISYFLNIVQDQEIRKILQFGLELSSEHVQRVRSIFNQENHPIPQGFTEQDVNINAPRLFSDSFMLYYMNNMGSMGLNSYSVALPNSAVGEFAEDGANLMIDNGWLEKPPSAPDRKALARS
jgi:hypothetical protein